MTISTNVLARGWATTLLGAAAVLVLPLVVQAADVPQGDAGKAFGKTVVATHEVPADVIQRYATHRASAAAPAPGESALTQVLYADSVDWTAPELPVEPSANPYVLSLRVRGQVLQDGDASSMWRAAWSEEGVERSLIVPGAARTGAKAGDTFDVEVASTPVQFKEAHAAMAPVVSFVRGSNLRIDAVEFKVWSGMPKASWRENLLPFQGAAVGLVMLLLVWWWRRN